MTIEGLTRVTASTLFVGLSRAESSMRRRFSEQSTCSIFFVCCCALIGTFFSMSTAAQKAFDQAIGIVLHGTIVTHGFRWGGSSRCCNSRPERHDCSSRGRVRRTIFRTLPLVAEPPE